MTLNRIFVPIRFISSHVYFRFLRSMPSREGIIRNFRAQVGKARARTDAQREAEGLPPLSTPIEFDPALDDKVCPLPFPNIS